MKREEVEDIIRGVLMSRDHGIKMPKDFDNNESLFMKGIIDSFGIFPFINELQGKFDLKIDDKDIHPGNLETIERLTTFIYNKKEGRY